MTAIDLAPSSEPRPEDPVAEPAMLWWQYATAVHAAADACARAWAQIFLPSAYPPHAHEPAPQLEVPDPIADDPEQDLFA